MTEIALAADSDMSPRPSDGGEPVTLSADEIEAIIQRRRTMSLAERIQEARDS